MSRTCPSTGNGRRTLSRSSRVDDTELRVGKAYSFEVEFRGRMVMGEHTITEYEPSRRFAIHTRDSTSEHHHAFAFYTQGEGTLLVWTAHGQWSFGMWLLAATVGGMLIGKPVMKKAHGQLKDRLEGQAARTKSRLS